jgi:transcriptional regulator with XRE-family HTH domain
MKIVGSATDAAILAELGVRLARHRLDRNLTQADLARESGVSKRTVERIEAGGSAQVSSLIRLVRALGLTPSLEAFVPEPSVSPVLQLKLQNKRRRRASAKSEGDSPRAKWSWGDEP